MDLWIRSQDKEKLIKCNNIAIKKIYIDIKENILNVPKTYKYKIIGYFDKNIEFEVLGLYESKERCEKILDDIQNRILINSLVHLDYKTALSNISIDDSQSIIENYSIYNMPSE